MTHHKKAAKLIRDLAVDVEKLAAKAQEQLDDGPERGGPRTEELEERVDAIEDAVSTLLAEADALELVP